MWHTNFGDGVLVTESEDGPFFKSVDGKIYFPKDSSHDGFLHRQKDMEYTQEEEDWIDEYVVITNIKTCKRMTSPPYGHKLVWDFGSTWRNEKQAIKIHEINNG